MIDTNGGVDDTDGYDTDGYDTDGYDTDGYDTEYDNDYDYDRVTARDIADLLHHLATMRCGGPLNSPNGVAIDPAGRAAFLTRKAKLFTRIARQAERTRVDDYSRQVRQMAADARRAADQAQHQLPQQQVGPNPRRTSDDQLAKDGARSQENSGASSG
jgi:hypothetical protein